MKKLIIQLQATQEADEAARWYEDQFPGLGVEFILELDAALHRIQSNPDIYQPVYDGVRRVLICRFPYAAYFLAEADTVRIVAILHQSRNPAVWQSRLP
ncbi:MAG: type II toxin-antitoxin system RelE/ParE family toxin [Gammaproteobacteria bacterium]